MTSLPNLIKIYLIFQKFMGGRDRQDGDLISLHISFRKESMLKMMVYADFSVIWKLNITILENKF
jgi:hypothetical protein